MRVTIYAKSAQFDMTACAGDNLYAIIRRAGGITLDTPCGGRHTCGKCRVTARGGISPAAEAEAKFLTESELRAGVRLACHTLITGDCEVWVGDASPMTIQVEGLRDSQLDLTPAPAPDGTPAKWGVAVDIGTTTVALYLCDLANGVTAATDAFVNPQRAHGADVITRLGYIIDNPGTDETHDGAQTLRGLLLGELNAHITRLCERTGITPGEIGCAALAGNTVMEHIAANRDARGIANTPFTVSTLFGYSLPAAEAGLAVDPAARVYYMPCFAAYVGGDIAAGLVAAGVDTAENTTLFIDVGTNGEMGLGDKSGICLCATAAGPAFEGAHIERGMAGVDVAVNGVWLEGGEIKYNMIGGGEPRGICGSGLIDAVAVMLDLGVLDETGRINNDGEDKFYLNREHDVYISGRDIRELQLAKAAVCGGVLTLLDDAGLTANDVSRVVLAGGFGAHINRRSACRIGLIPPELEDKINVAGNTAGMGAVSYLMSAAARERIDRINGDSTHYLELSCNEFFMDAYIEQMMF